MDRRGFLAIGLGSLGLAAVSRPLLEALTDGDDPQPKQTTTTVRRGDGPLAVGPLQPADENGLRLPSGFRSRIIGRSGEIVDGTDYRWHRAPDGGTCFPAEDGGWIYVSNSEVGDGGGGVGAVEFAADGSIVAAEAILVGSSRNCAGGPTPWQTWLSCEEHAEGIVWECDPRRKSEAIGRPALGTFQHEAAAVDLAGGHVYMTEDEPDGRFYRFTPQKRSRAELDLSSGVLEVAEVRGSSKTGPVVWHAIENPRPKRGDRPTRLQVDEATSFDGGEGAWFFEGHVYWTTKGDDRVYDYDTAAGNLRVVYDAAAVEQPVLRGVDNITITPRGDLLVAEDGDNMQLCMIELDGAGTPTVTPLVEIPGHSKSEVTGPAFSPDGTRLYFSSQRGPDDEGDRGVTYEVVGPFA